jgi:hypothetical protein
MLKTWWVIHWAKGESRLMGPFSETAMRSKLMTEELSWADLAKLDGKGDRAAWDRLYEIPEFHGSLPVISPERIAQLESGQKQAAQMAKVRMENTASGVKNSANESAWYLQFDGSEFGPFVPAEMIRIIQSNKLKGNLYAWRKGIPNWVPIKSLDQALELVNREIVALPEDEKTPIAEGISQRLAKRTALVATIALVEGSKKTVLGICTDISQTGMQLKTEESHSLEASKSYMLEIQPAGISRMKAFRVTAEVSWIDPEGKKIGFRFGKLMDSDLRNLEIYLGMRTG